MRQIFVVDCCIKILYISQTNSETDDSEKSAPESIDSHVSDSDGGHWYDDFFGVYGAAFDDEIDFGTPLPSDSDVGQSDGEDNNNLEAVQIALQQPQQQEHNDGDDVNEHQQPQQEKAEAFDPGVAIVIPTKSKSGRCTKRVIYPVSFFFFFTTHIA